MQIQIGFTPEASTLVTKFIHSMEVLGNAKPAKGATQSNVTRTVAGGETPEETDGINMTDLKNGVGGEAEQEEDLLGGGETEAEEVTLQDVIAALTPYTEKQGKPALIKLLGKFKAKNVRALKPEQYAEVIKATKGSKK
jgi:hypothetical protein